MIHHHLPWFRRSPRSIKIAMPNGTWLDAKLPSHPNSVSPSPTTTPPTKKQKQNYRTIAWGRAGVRGRPTS